MSKEEAPKEKKPIDKQFRDRLLTIVEELGLQADSRERVTETIKELCGDYGVSRSSVRRAAKTLYTDSLEKLESETAEVVSILENFTKQ